MNVVRILIGISKLERLRARLSATNRINAPVIAESKHQEKLILLIAKRAR